MFPVSFLQVTVEYKTIKGHLEALRVHTVVISTQHDPDISQEQLQQALKDKVIDSVIPAKYLDDNTVYHLNPSGSFVIGTSTFMTCN